MQVIGFSLYIVKVTSEGEPWRNRKVVVM